ncbi:MAG: molybdopterin oxidoreductase [Oligoflexia bacterium]|nr:molybdopterin oxidoreductase [Oligoflexia bacterium]
MANHDSHAEIKNPGSFDAPASIKGALVVMAVLGLAAFAGGLATDAKRAWASFLMNHFYFFSLALGGMFFAAIQWLTGAMWSAPLRRVSEAFTSYLPFVVVTFIVLCFGLKLMYIWTDPAVVASDAMIRLKSSYLNTGFFVVRNLVALALLIFFTWKMVGNSIAQDATKDVRFTLSNRRLAPAFIAFFALLYSMASVDQIMSLEPMWYSTMFGVYCFAGLFYQVLAATCLLTIYLHSTGKLKGLVNDNHLHDLGKFMLAFTVFYAYIGFSQFMLYWYANIPEETAYYMHRMTSGWMPVSIFLLAGKFGVPFFALLPRDAKRNVKTLTWVGIFMLIANWIDVMWMVQPSFFPDGPRFSWIELGTSVGFLGIFGLFVVRFLARHNVVAIGDPRLAESVLHHHQ